MCRRDNCATIFGCILCLLALSGILLLGLASTSLPTSLTKEEMRIGLNGQICTPDLCSQILTEKQKKSEGFTMILIGASFLGFTFLSSCGVLVTISCCTIYRVEPLEQDSQPTEMPV
jgi:hypothetical protein